MSAASSRLTELLDFGNVYVCLDVCMCVHFFSYCLHTVYFIAVRCKLLHITRKPNAMFVGPCCTVCHCLCVNRLFPCRLPWTGSLRQIWDTLEHERQVILSQHHLTAVILVIFPDSNCTQMLHNHVLMQTSCCQACYMYELLDFL
jgi:hypothetical protein